jgi:hypothetical protein
MKKTLAIGALALAPVLASAQAFGNVNSLLNGFRGLINPALAIVTGLAILAFFWGLLKFIFSAGDEEERKKGRGYMIWSLVALFVMFSVWGLLQFIGNAFNIQNTQGGQFNVTTPTVNGQGVQ